MKTGRHSPAVSAKPRWQRILILAFIVLLTLTALLITTVLILERQGRNSLHEIDNGSAVPMLPIAETEPGEKDDGSDEPADAGPSEAPGGELLDSYTIKVNGRLYRPKENITTLLLIGVDRDSPEDIKGSEYNSDARADVLILAVMDEDAGTVSFIALNRDTMCTLEIPDADGNIVGEAYEQLALSFRHGDGTLSSCKATAAAVSELLYDLPIHSVAAFYLDGIPKLNDAAGGVTLTALETVASFREGKTVTLKGTKAESYVRSRKSTVEGNLKRMARQKQYFMQLLIQLKSEIKARPSRIWDYYDVVKSYLVTDLSLAQMSYLSMEAVSLHLAADILTVPGEITLGENGLAEYTIDEEGLTELLLSVYYTDVTPESTAE